MNRNRLIIYSALVLFTAVIVFMPLRIIVGGEGVTARKVEGIMWDGSIRDLHVGKLAIGDVNARLHFLPLFLGQAQISFSRGDAPFAPGTDGSVTRRLGGISIDKVNATFLVSTLFAPLPAENLELKDTSVRFTAGRCTDASGSVRLTLANSIPGLDLSNGLLGQPRCDRGQLLIPLLSQSAMEHVDIRISSDGAYTASIFLEGDRTEYAAPLALSGFRSVSGGYRIVKKGQF